MNLHRLWSVVAFVSLILPAVGCSTSDAQESSADGIYTHGKASRDGRGKFYMGRELAQTMSYHGASWLERSERQREEQPDEVIAAMRLAPSATVADLGAGSGYFTLRLAKAVPEGRVLAVDIQPEMLEILDENRKRQGLENVELVLGTEDDPNLPPGVVDAVLMVDAYHEFAYPKEMMEAVVRSLSPDGRVFLVEYRGEDPKVAIKPLHKMTQEQVRTEMSAVGLEWVETQDFLASQHFLVFRKVERGSTSMSQQQHDKRVDYIEFNATDLEKIKTFYSAVFGWKFTDWGPTYVSFEDGRLAGGFSQADAVEPGGPLVVIYAVELEAVAEAVKSSGGSIVKEIFEFPGGRRFHFADPSGNVLAVWSEP